MALIVNMERVIDRVILEIGDESRNVDDCHGPSLPRRWDRSRC
ncbi:unannotated protein [freshwater metagenome]|uniref:Unannotated protein n=1 Tax=freshwater metagenome TaxID=449393 RepID=A0A6J7KSW1_9ZZZZ